MRTSYSILAQDDTEWSLIKGPNSIMFLAAKAQLNTYTSVCLSVRPSVVKPEFLPIWFPFHAFLCLWQLAYDSWWLLANNSWWQLMTADCRVCLSVHFKTESLPVYSLLGPCLIIAVYNLKLLYKTVHSTVQNCTYVNYVVHNYTFRAVINNYTFLTAVHSCTLFLCTNFTFCTLVQNCTLVRCKIHFIGF